MAQGARHDAARGEQDEQVEGRDHIPAQVEEHERAPRLEDAGNFVQHGDRIRPVMQGQCADDEVERAVCKRCRGRIAGAEAGARREPCGCGVLARFVEERIGEIDAGDVQPGCSLRQLDGQPA